MIKQTLKYILLLVVPILVINQQTIANVIISQNFSTQHSISHLSSQEKTITTTSDNLAQDIFLVSEFDNENEDQIDIDFLYNTVYQIINKLFEPCASFGKTFFSPQVEVKTSVQKYILYCSLKLDC